MGNRIDKLPVDTIISYQQILDFTSRQMHGLFNEIHTCFEKGEVSRDFRDKMEKIFFDRISRNNEVSASIDTEVFRRIKRDLGGGLTNMRELPKFSQMFEDEKAMVLHASKKKSKPKLSLVGGSKEKKNDNLKK
jgi:hypothetical protein